MTCQPLGWGCVFLSTPMHVSLLLFFLLGKHQEFFESPKIWRNCLTELRGLTKE